MTQKVGFLFELLALQHLHLLFECLALEETLSLVLEAFAFDAL